MAFRAISSFIPQTIRDGLADGLALLGLNPTDDPPPSSPPSNSSENSPTRKSSRNPWHIQEVLAVRDILLKFFPPELVYIILDLAEHYVRVKSDRDDHVKVSASAMGIPSPPGASTCYLITSPILHTHPISSPETNTASDHAADFREDSEEEKEEKNEVLVKVARVEFTIVSRDQGWCSDQAIRGTYRGSTWFEAAILRPSQASSPSPSPLPPPTGLDTTIGWDPVLEVKYSPSSPDISPKSRFQIQHNRCAHQEYLTHRVVWRSGSEEFESAEQDLERQERGCGDGLGFVGSLVEGDRIAVIARAVYPGWENRVQRVEVAVFYRLA
ncbi:hypothetical protein R3P38DRAFT_2888199 [Favolaschia claudopus]|uniref:Uncharacterized protein n=1 Tax=Favolaschia claudopus TaxID=2862362 RepID=A0AAW0CT62_9AGAR